MSVFELQTDHLIAAFDAGFQEEDLPVGANPDSFDPNGPNRFTIWVPTEHVIVNMGNPVRSGTVGLLNTYENVTDTVQVDGGFVAQTDHHIHFHTLGDRLNQPPGGPSRTVLRLGSPVTVVKASTGGRGAVNRNAIQSSTDIGSVYPPPYTSWDGYAMVTEGASYQESWGNNLVVSGDADVRVVGRRSVVIGSPSDVHIMADESTGVAHMAGNATIDTDLLGSGNWVDQKKGFKILRGILGGISLGITGFTTFWSFYGMEYSRPAEVGRPGWKGYCKGDALEIFNDLAGSAGSLIAPVVAIIGAVGAIEKAAEAGDPKTTGGEAGHSITLFASKDINAVASNSMAISSELFLTVSSGLTTSVSSTVATGISSLISTTVSGVATSMSGLLSASVSSMFGSATVTGKTKAQLSSWGKVFVSSNDDAQLNSMDGRVYVHGVKGFYVGCGAGAPSPVKLGALTTGTKYADGPGYGMHGDPENGLTLGKLDFATVFKIPLFCEKETTRSLVNISDTGIRLQYKNSDITIYDQGVSVSSKGGKRIFLG